MMSDLNPRDHETQTKRLIDLVTTSVQQQQEVSTALTHALRTFEKLTSQIDLSDMLRAPTLVERTVITEIDASPAAPPTFSPANRRLMLEYDCLRSDMAYDRSRRVYVGMRHQDDATTCLQFEDSGGLQACSAVAWIRPEGRVAGPLAEIVSKLHFDDQPTRPYASFSAGVPEGAYVELRDRYDAPVAVGRWVTPAPTMKEAS